MPRLRAVWATLQAFLMLATLGWGAFLLTSTHEAPWAAGNFAAAVFFLVTVFLFARDHQDGRIVGAFGLAVFVITNGLLVYTAATEGLARFAVNESDPDLTWTRSTVAWLMAGASAAIALPESLLVIFGHGPRHEPVEPSPEMPA